jgi:hypothetical protein
VGAVKARLPVLDFVVQPLKQREPNPLTLDSEQAQLELGWRPQWGIETTLEKARETYATQHDSSELLTDLGAHEGLTLRGCQRCGLGFILS